MMLTKPANSSNFQLLSSNHNTQESQNLVHDDDDNDMNENITANVNKKSVDYTADYDFGHVNDEQHFRDTSLLSISNHQKDTMATREDDVIGKPPKSTYSGYSNPNQLNCQQNQSHGHFIWFNILLHYSGMWVTRKTNNKRRNKYLNIFVITLILLSFIGQIFMRYKELERFDDITFYVLEVIIATGLQLFRITLRLLHSSHFLLKSKHCIDYSHWISPDWLMKNENKTKEQRIKSDKYAAFLSFWYVLYVFCLFI